VRRSPIVGRSERAVSAVVLVATVLAGCEADEPASRAALSVPAVVYVVRIAEPASGLVRVHAEIPRQALAGDRILRIRFGGLGPESDALETLRAVADGRSLDVTYEAGGADRVALITLNEAPEPLILEYTLDPTFFPPGSTSTTPADARARIGPDFAILRTSRLFPTFDGHAFAAHVAFDLPEGWEAVTPWSREGDGFRLSPDDHAAVDYVGLGPFEIGAVTVDGTPFLVAVQVRTARWGAVEVAALVRHYASLAGVTPLGTEPRAVIIVSASFMRGGAAGHRSIVQGSSAVTLAHEVFHWWLRAGLVRPEAAWFGEGVTNYYGITAARDAGLITEDEADECLADLSAEMTFLEAEGVRSLESVSTDYGRDSGAHRLVYSKGTLFAVFLQQALGSHGRTLDDVIDAILSEGRDGLTNADLRAAFARVYGTEIASMFDAFVTNARALPDLGLGPASGESGCARTRPGAGAPIDIR